MPDWIVPIILLLLAFGATLDAAITKDESGKRSVVSLWPICIGFLALIASAYVYFDDREQQKGRDNLDAQVSRTVQRIDSASNVVIDKFGSIDSVLSTASDSIDTANVRLASVLDEMDQALIRNRELARAMNRQSNELAKQFSANKPALIVYTDEFDTIAQYIDTTIVRSLQAKITNTGGREAANVTVETLSIYSVGSPTRLADSKVFRTKIETIPNLPPGSRATFTVHDLSADIDSVDTGILCFVINYHDAVALQDTSINQYIRYSDQELPKQGHFRLYTREYQSTYNQMFIDGGVPHFYIFD